jgi:hypothetical protein
MRLKSRKMTLESEGWFIRGVVSWVYRRLGFTQERIDEALDKIWLTNRQRLIGYDPPPDIKQEQMSQTIEEIIKKMEEKQ